MIKFLDLQQQYQSIKSEIDQAISNVIRDSAFIGGKYVQKFESNFAAFQHAEYCVGVGNGTDALEIAIEALGLPDGGEIIVPANSFIASAESVTRSGYKVVFCDVNADDYTLDLKDVVKRMTSNTVAIMAVHLYGHPCDMDGLLAIAQKHDLRIIEDCAQAHGAEYKGKRVGAIGDIGCFSFYPGKNLGAYGDGGAIVSNDEKLADRCRMIANHGRIKKYDHEFEGRNSRLDGLQAAILDVKLKRLESWTDARISVADYYLENLKGVSEVILPKRKDWAKQAYHLFVIRAENRDRLQQQLKDSGVQTGVHYPVMLPALKAYAYLGHCLEDFPVANACSETILSLPIYPELSGDDMRMVVGKLKEALIA